MSNRATGPVFDGEIVRWGSTAVSRRAYEAARELLADAKQPTEQDDDEVADSTVPTIPIVPNSADSSHLGLIVAPIVESRTDEHSRQHMGTKAAFAPRETMTAAEVAHEAAAHYKTVRRWIREGKLPAKKTKTGRLRILRVDFLKFMGFDK